MNMSSACTAPKQPIVSEQQKHDPVYSAYRNYVSACARQLVAADSFESWKEFYEQTTTYHVYQYCASQLWGWHILSKSYGSTDAPIMTAGERAKYNTEAEAQNALNQYLEVNK